MSRSNASPLATAGLLAALALLLPRLLAAQEDPAPKAGRYMGVASCASGTCHGSTVPRDAYPVLQNEFFTWSQEDRHADQHQADADPA